MRSLAADGVAKAAAGLTTIEEVLRVASGEG
jgi:general secretion pathway protein E